MRGLVSGAGAPELSLAMDPHMGPPSGLCARDSREGLREGEARRESYERARGYPLRMHIACLAASKDWFGIRSKMWTVSLPAKRFVPYMFQNDT